MRRFGSAALVICAAGMLAGGSAKAQELGELVRRCAPKVHPQTMLAVVMQESGGNPFAIGINGGPRLERQPVTFSEAVATAEVLKAKGYNFDAGLGQINVKNFSWLGLRVADLFDPCANLRAAATVLADCYDRAARGRGDGQGALHAALSCYNTGSMTRGVGNGYVAKVARKAGAGATRVVQNVEVPAPLVKQADPQTVSLAQATPAPGESGAFSVRRKDAFSKFAEGAATTSEH